MYCIFRFNLVHIFFSSLLSSSLSQEYVHTFLDNDKPVFNVEYNLGKSICDSANKMGLDTIVKVRTTVRPKPVCVCIFEPTLRALKPFLTLISSNLSQKRVSGWKGVKVRELLAHVVHIGSRQHDLASTGSQTINTLRAPAIVFPCSYASLEAKSSDTLVSPSLMFDLASISLWARINAAQESHERDRDLSQASNIGKAL